MKLAKAIVNVPTNIITGFLGSGKTTAILHLLKNKPENENWAILVNEFGEIGVDGTLISGQNSDQQVFIREVPGGCMCCAAGLPMQIALNELLNRAQPDRLIIEPTGLGHPREVLDVLTGVHYRETLDVQATITLVDARKLNDTRYTSHKTFNQQIAIADVIVGNKADLYTGDEPALLLSYVQQHGAGHALVTITEQGAVNPELLTTRSGAKSEPDHSQHHHHNDAPLAADLPIPGCGYLKVENHGEGYMSIGWRFSKTKLFKRQELLHFLPQIQAERLKATLNTDEGVFSYNQTSDGLTEQPMTSCDESRIEIIATKANASWQPDLLACLA